MAPKGKAAKKQAEITANENPDTVADKPAMDPGSQSSVTTAKGAATNGDSHAETKGSVAASSNSHSNEALGDGKRKGGVKPPAKRGPKKQDVKESQTESNDVEEKKTAHVKGKQVVEKGKSKEKAGEAKASTKAGVKKAKAAKKPAAAGARVMPSRAVKNK